MTRPVIIHVRRVGYENAGRGTFCGQETYGRDAVIWKECIDHFPPTPKHRICKRCLTGLKQWQKQQ